MDMHMHTDILLDFSPEVFSNATPIYYAGKIVDIRSLKLTLECKLHKGSSPLSPM